MTEKKGYERLVSDLSSLHVRALDAIEPELQNSQAHFRTRLEQAARRDDNRRQAPGMTFRAVRGRPLGLLVASAAALAVVAFGGLAFIRRPVMKVEIAPEPSRSAARNGPALVNSAAMTRPTADPCIYHVRAKGDRPLIDDFEDGNPLISSLEDRVGLWAMYKDTDVSGTAMPLTPTLRANSSHDNRFALHAVGGELRDWGATVQFAFQPSCYDASAYGGIAFSAKGPGRVYVGVREVRVVPVQWGGTCTRDCYDTHQKKVDLSAQWQKYIIKWDELRQRGYSSPPLDATRINGLGFLVQPGDTPFDFWLDDVKFIAR